MKTSFAYLGKLCLQQVPHGFLIFNNILLIFFVSESHTLHALQDSGEDFWLQRRRAELLCVVLSSQSRQCLPLCHLSVQHSLSCPCLYWMPSYCLQLVILSSRRSMMIKLVVSGFLLWLIKHRRDFNNSKMMSEVVNDKKKIRESNFAFIDINIIKQVNWMGNFIIQIPLLVRKAVWWSKRNIHI